MQNILLHLNVSYFLIYNDAVIKKGQPTSSLLLLNINLLEIKINNVVRNTKTWEKKDRNYTPIIKIIEHVNNHDKNSIRGKLYETWERNK